MTTWTPLFLEPVYKSLIWGGGRIAADYARHGTPTVCAESWEVAAHPEGACRVTNGPFAGETLDTLAARFGTDLTGTKAPDPTRFPLLVKIIDARDTLSVQVHPNEKTAVVTGGEPKTEMWYVLGTTPDAALYAGLKPGTTAATLRASLANGTTASCLPRLAVAPGQALFIPGGLVHAIGAGCLIYEVQQSSNTTYRLFDWNRTDAAGNPRQLHIEAAFQSIDWNLPPPTMITPVPRPDGNGNRRATVVSCPFFTVDRLLCDREIPLAGSPETFQILFVEHGRGILRAAGSDAPMRTGDSVLLPAGLPAAFIPDTSEAALLLTTL